MKEGGPDPENNSRLRALIQNAKAANMPKDNIERAIDKSSIAADSNFENIRYEGFGPAKTAIVVLTLTDNKNRSASNIRTIFQKYGGGLGTHGSASHNFLQLGVIKINKEEIEEEIEKSGLNYTIFQCSMCKAVLESGADQKVAESLNDGIVYLMAIPYVLVALIGFLIYYKFFRKT